MIALTKAICLRVAALLFLKALVLDRYVNWRSCEHREDSKQKAVFIMSLESDLLASLGLEKRVGAHVSTSLERERG